MQGPTYRFLCYLAYILSDVDTFRLVGEAPGRVFILVVDYKLVGAGQLGA